jgi:signal transduction histidine kinase
VDLALGAFFLVVSSGSVLTGNPDEGSVAVTLPVAVAMSLAVAWRRRAAVTAVVVGVVALVAQSLLADPAGSLWAFAAMLLLTYSVASERDEGPAAAGGLVMLAGQFLTEKVDGGVDYVFIVIVFGGAWLIGRAVRGWRGRATYAEQHQHDLALLAVAEERVRIARELHDVVAHSLSVIAVQADAAEAALAHDAALAAAPMRAIRDSAREALTDMRQMLQLLRDDDRDREPARGLMDLPELVAAMRAAGLDVDAELPGQVDVHPAVGLTAYRVVQEGLTNALRYGDPAGASLRVVLTPAAVEVRLRNRAGNRPGELGGGRGLIGLRERVSATGGVLTARPVNGWFELEARIPVGESS